MSCCKHSKNAPYCDGSHATLKEESSSADTVSEATSGDSTKEEPTLAYIKTLAKDGLSKTGHHGEMGAMGVPIPELPQWKDIQLLAAQMATKPLMEDVAVASELIIGPNAKKPLKLDCGQIIKDFPIAYSEHSTKAAANRWRLKNNRTATTKVEEL